MTKIRGLGLAVLFVFGGAVLMPALAGPTTKLTVTNNSKSKTSPTVFQKPPAPITARKKR